VKKSVVGAGRAEKAQVRMMIGILLPKATPQTEDASDALAVAVTHAHQRGAVESGIIVFTAFSSREPQSTSLENAGVSHRGERA
jgi:hypothetical protein